MASNDQGSSAVDLERVRSPGVGDSAADRVQVFADLLLKYDETLRRKAVMLLGRTYSHRADCCVQNMMVHLLGHVQSGKIEPTIGILFKDLRYQCLTVRREETRRDRRQEIHAVRAAKRCPPRRPDEIASKKELRPLVHTIARATLARYPEFDQALVIAVEGFFGAKPASYQLILNNPEYKSLLDEHDITTITALRSRVHRCLIKGRSGEPGFWFKFKESLTQQQLESEWSLVYDPETETDELD